MSLRLQRDVSVTMIDDNIVLLMNGPAVTGSSTSRDRRLSASFLTATPQLRSYSTSPTPTAWIRGTSLLI